MSSNEPPTGPIHFIFTGGTIDSYWNAPQDTATPAEHSLIPAYLERLNLAVTPIFTEICMKDSRSLTREDIDNVRKAIEDSPSEHIVDRPI